MPETVQPASTRQTANAVRPGGGKERLRRRRDERGAATAEYVIATMAAVGFAGLLIVILRGDEVRGILTDLVRNALTVG
jgi:Flp pilus assembly pilin Flp